MMRIKIVPVLAAVIMLCACSLPASDNKDGSTLPFSSDNNASEYQLTQDASASNNRQTQTVSYEGTVPVTLYYQDIDGYIVPVTRRIAKQDGIAKATVKGLIDSSLSREKLEYFGLYPTIPEGTVIRGLNIKEGLATIDFNEGFLGSKSKAEEKNAITSLVYTLTEFKTITNIKILINGKTINKSNFGNDFSGYFSRDNTLVNMANLKTAEGFNKVDVYFFKKANSNYTYIIPVSFEEPAEPDMNQAESVIEHLVDSGLPKGLSSEIPDGVVLIGSSVKDNILTLNFSQELLKYGGTTREEGILQQLLLPMKQIKGITSVKILIDGKSAQLPEGTDISKAVALPVTVNDVVDI